jgi:hypothetical protein
MPGEPSALGARKAVNEKVKFAMCNPGSVVPTVVRHARVLEL